MTSEYIDELTIIGYNEIPEVATIFETTGQFYVHRSCALWSHGVTRTGIYKHFPYFHRNLCESKCINSI